MPHLSREEKIILSASSKMSLFAEKFENMERGGTISASTSGGESQGIEMLTEGGDASVEGAERAFVRASLEEGSSTLGPTLHRSSVVSLGAEIEAGMAKINLDGSTEVDGMLDPSATSPSSLAPPSQYLNHDLNATPTSSTAPFMTQPNIPSRTRQTSSGSHVSTSTFSTSYRGRLSAVSSPDPSSRLGTNGAKGTRDTHFFTAHATFRKTKSPSNGGDVEDDDDGVQQARDTIPFPFQIPMDSFDEEVGRVSQYQLIPNGSAECTAVHEPLAHLVLCVSVRPARSATSRNLSRSSSTRHIPFRRPTFHHYTHRLPTPIP